MSKMTAQRAQGVLEAAAKSACHVPQDVFISEATGQITRLAWKSLTERAAPLVPADGALTNDAGAIYLGTIGPLNP